MSAFLSLLSYARRTVTRARTRSLLTVLGTALAMGLFAFLQTVEAGVDRAAQGADQPVLVVFQSSRFCPLQSALPTRYADEIRAVEGVESVLPTLLYINVCRANLDLVTLHGIPTTDLSKVHDLSLVEGDLESWKSRPDGALVGRRLAVRRGIKPGDRVQLGKVTVFVGGIVESSGGSLDSTAFVHLEPLQLARSMPGKATEFIVRLAPGADPTEVSRRIDALFAREVQSTDTKTMQAFVQAAVGEISEVVEFGRGLGIVAVLVVVLILGNTVWISAQTRAVELGVLETIGATRGLLASLVLVEGVVLALLGGILGTAAVVAWFGLSPETLGIEGHSIDFLAEPSLLLLGVALSVVVGLVAAGGPAAAILRRPLADAVKSS